MRACHTNSHDLPGFQGPALLSWMVVLLTLSILASTSGCRGCDGSKARKTAAKNKKKDTLEEELERRKKKKKKKKPPYEIGDLETLPADDSKLSNFAKSGHFVTGVVQARANEFDFRGDFETAAVDQRNRPLLVEGTRYHVSMTRPVALPKGQTKYLQSTFFIPLATERDRRTVFLRNTLRPAIGGRIVHEASQVTRRLAAYQYLMVVLATNPNGYGYLKQLESIRSPYDEMRAQEERLLYYRVVLPNVQRRVPLPTHPFAWTSIAYVVWDGLHPGLLRTGQRQAMLDWLHSGGQLIISGPGSLDRLKGSFLDPYLPASAGRALKLGPDAFEQLNQHWSLHRVKTKEHLVLNVLQEKPIVGVELAKRPDAEFLLGTGRLVVERRVGRGRVVVTAFGLTGRSIVNWASYDSFFNACLLRRPARRFFSNAHGSPMVTWADYPTRARDSSFVTSVRYFSRDLGPWSASSKEGEEVVEDWHLDGCRPAPQSGLAGWNDHSGVSETAHRLLNQAAGIKIPNADFVLRVLAIYLVILVPVNWVFFRLIGRLEWAWISAPILAILGALAVIYFAQLDIGFARSRTEAATLEVEGGYPRAHLTRYLALYTSLASGYELRFEDPSAVAFPFPPTSSSPSGGRLVFRRDRDVRLSGFQIASNKTGYLHAEQMLELSGTIELGGQPGTWRLRNRGELHLRDAGVLWRTRDGQVRVCWLGDVAPKTIRELNFDPAIGGLPWMKQWSSLRVDATEPNRVPLKELFELAARQLRLQPGDLRLLAWTRQQLPGMTIRPKASQRRTDTMVLVHLRRGHIPPPKPDLNLLVDVLTDADVKPESSPESGPNQAGSQDPPRDDTSPDRKPR